MMVAEEIAGLESVIYVGHFLFYFILVGKLNMRLTLLTIFSVNNTVLLTAVQCCIAAL